MSPTQTWKSRKSDPTSPEPVVRIDSEVTRRVRQHARAHPKTEVCGVLIGGNEDGPIDIRASIEGVNAEQAGTHVTFTQDAWEAIYRIKDEQYPDDRIVGWYHSHPGFGVFLSEHDLFIQQNFFSSPGQVAWVYDPHTDEEGCFGWVGGEIHRITKLSIDDRNGEGTERTPKRTESAIEEESDLAPAGHEESRRTSPPRWAHLVMTALSHLSIMFLGFMVAYFLCPLVLLLGLDPMTGGVVVLRQGHVLVLPGTDKIAIPDDRPGPRDGQFETPFPGAASPPSAQRPAPNQQPVKPGVMPQSGQSAKPSPSGGH